MYKYKFVCDTCGKEKLVEIKNEMVYGDTPDSWIPLFICGRLYAACSSRCHTSLFKRAGVVFKHPSKYPAEIQAKPHLTE